MWSFLFVTLCMLIYVCSVLENLEYTSTWNGAMIHTAVSFFGLHSRRIEFTDVVVNYFAGYERGCQGPGDETQRNPKFPTVAEGVE